MRSLEKDVCMFPKWSVLIPRSVRVSGNIAILKTTYNVSSNFIVVNCQDKRSAVLTASWLFSIFGQLQMEFLCNDQEGARKLEKNEISKLLIPQNLDEISENDFTEIYNAFKESEPINYRNINLREIDKVWSSMLLETKDVHLQSAMNYLQDLVDERSP